MKLNSGARVKHYEIRSLLGVGGMGEVYLAHDTRLGRDVAIKFLKQTDDREKLARFRREAKVISSLNHPNIVTVFEFGQHENNHYIVTELIRGKVLRREIAAKGQTIDEILDIAIQISNALTAAHAAGIIHRDIKPENIMVLPDGYVKVLDFGLAKLSGADAVVSNQEDVTNTLIQTRSGMILGTVSYMSPEQLRGKDVDERTDIWSLGVVLYEMLVNQRPFEGDSVSDIIASVLHNSLPPIRETAPHIPPEVAAIVEKTLAKDKSERYASAKELTADLKNAKLLHSTASGAAFSAGQAKTQTLLTKTHQPQATIPHTETENRSWKIFASIAAMILLAFGGYFAYQAFYAQSPTANRQMKIKRLPTSGNIKNATISHDGKFVAYVQNENGQDSLWLRQTEETGGQELLPASAASYSGLAFSPDGKFIYFTVFEKSSSGILYRIPFLGGGSRQEIVKNVESSVSFSPDGKELVFIRALPPILADQIIIVGADGSNERVLAEKKRPEFFFSSFAKESPSWSPDGKTIAAPLGKTDADGDFMTIAEIDVASGQLKEMIAKKWFRVGRVVWTNNANELLITAADIGSDLYQIFKVSRSDSKAQVVAQNLNDYYNLSLTKDSTRLLGLTNDKEARIFTAPSDKPTKTNEIMGGGGEGAEGVVWAANGQLIYTSMASGNRDIWAVNADDKNSRRLTFEESHDEFPSVSADGKIVFVSSRSGTPHIWQMSVEGGSAKQLTSKGGESFPQITPDGKTVVFTAYGETNKVLWKMPLDGGEPVQLTKSSTGWILASWAAMSPDGKLVACLSKEGGNETPIKLSVVSIEDGSFLNTFLLPFGIAAPDTTPVLRWTADGKAITYIVTRNGVSNIWTQQLSGGEAKQLTDFSAERIFSFDWSKDGKQIVYSRGIVRNSLILIEDF